MGTEPDFCLKPQRSQRTQRKNEGVATDPRRHRGTGKEAVSDEHENSGKPWSVPYFFIIFERTGTHSDLFKA